MESTTTGVPIAHASDAADQWNDLVARYRAAEDAPLTDNEDRNEADGDLAFELIGQILALPAPNAAAARWKLDWLFSHGRAGVYADEYIAQTIADYRRFLGGETDRTAWTRALAHFKTVLQKWNAHPYNTARPGTPDYPRLQRENAALFQSHMEALSAVQLASTPDIEAVIEKLKIFVSEHDIGEDEEGWVRSAIADLRHLTGTAC